MRSDVGVREHVASVNETFAGVRIDGVPSSEGIGVGQQLRADLEATRAAYHQLVRELSAEDWRRQSGNLAWTIGEVLYHMTLALRLLPGDVRLIRGKGWTPKLPAQLFNWLNVLFTRLGARTVTLQTVGQKYDAAHATVLELLATVQDDEWERGAEYPDWDPLLSGFVALSRLFGYPTIHFEAHAEQIRQGLEHSGSRIELTSVEGATHGV